MKQTIIREWKDDDKVVCTYHIKTLMLWACERKSTVWWESNCVLVLCSKLLDTLMKWIRKKMCPHYFIPEWNLFDYTMKDSRRLDTIEMLNIYTNIRTLSEWCTTSYLSEVFADNSERQHALNTIVASDWSNKDFQTILQKWVDERYSLLLLFYFNDITTRLNETIRWNAIRLCLLIHSENLAPESQFKNLALASLCIAWNISWMKESELSNHELLDVLSEVVLKLSGHDTWNCNTAYNISFKECSKWYFIKGVRLLSIYCEERSAAYCL